MNDVLPECGGFLPVRIDEGGYILSRTSNGIEFVIHRESVNLHTKPECRGSFVVAKQELSRDADVAILELTVDGSGGAVWMRNHQQQVLSRRLARFRGCYGAWPVRILNT